jgi:hypothetical protein
MIAYRGYHYARRRNGACRVYLEITKDGRYVSYADTAEEARALIDTYLSWHGA